MVNTYFGQRPVYTLVDLPSNKFLENNGIGATAVPLYPIKSEPQISTNPALDMLVVAHCGAFLIVFQSYQALFVAVGQPKAIALPD